MKENSVLLNDEELKVMGGEPTLHPRVVDVVHEAYYHFNIVKLFTNGSTMSKITKDPRMIKTHFEGVTRYLINGYTFQPEKFHEYENFIREIILHCVIPLENVDEFISRVFSFVELSPQIRIALSCNTQVNLFDDEIMEKYRESWMKATLTLTRPLEMEGRFFGFDHSFPMCFFTQDMLNTYHLHGMGNFVHKRTHCCSEFALGLIDWNYDLYYCNQTRFKIGSVLNEDGNMKSLPEINKSLQLTGQVKCDMIKERSEKCKDCIVLPACKVGCYYNVLQ